MTTFKINTDAPLVYSEEFTVRSYHVDINRRLTIQKLCSFFQDIAGNHTVACGVGWEVMQDENLFWVLSRMKIEVNKYPEWRDQITIRTWSNGLDGLMAVRNFQVLSAKGEVVVKAISQWVMVNTETRRFVRADDFMRDFPLNAERLFENNPGKIEALKEGVKFGASEVSFTETDMNRHMNNVSYIDRIVNTYESEFLLSHQICDFEINFMKEAVPCESILVQQQKLSETEFLNNIIQEEGGKEMVRTKIVWQ
ncbi:MAG: acyl-[acyl-carrier-protein] thioesterase [Prolixibacteraceae bacterium]